MIIIRVIIIKIIIIITIIIIELQIEFLRSMLLGKRHEN